MTQNLYSITTTVAGTDLPPMVFIVSAASEVEAVDAATHDALQNGVDEALLDIASFNTLDISQIAFDFVDEHMMAYKPSIFQRVSDELGGDDETARDVIQIIIDNTESSYTIDELSRILSEEA